MNMQIEQGSYADQIDMGYMCSQAAMVKKEIVENANTINYQKVYRLSETIGLFYFCELKQLFIH